MTSLYGLVDHVFTLFEDTIQAVFVSDFIMGKHIEAGFRMGYAKFTGGSLTFQLRCVAVRLFFVLIVHQFYKSQIGGLFANDVTNRISTKVKESQSVNARVARKVYRPLKKGQIRLVRLHPSFSKGTELIDGVETTIECSLFTIDLDNHPNQAYEAVSYVWGSDSNLQAIQLNQERFWVTENLSAALEALRLPDKDRILWIDALAINQSSFAERASQVKHMQRIYSCSRDTLIWLNDDNVCEIENNPIWVHFCSHWRRHQAEEPSPTGTPQRIWDGEHLSTLLSSLSSLKYWHRVWTAQEVVYSKQATLVTPFGSVPFGILEDLLATEVTQGDPSTRDFDSSMEEFKKTCLMLRPNTVSEGRDLATWIQMCISRNCYDPRDYVFGLSGCFTPSVRQQVKVDYFLGPDDVVKEATLAFLRHEGCLDYLRHSNYFNQASRWINGLPSWLPDFRPERAKKVARHDLDRIPHPSTVGSEPTPVFLEALENSSVLHVHGRWIGKVEKVDRGWDPPQGETNKARALRPLSRLRIRMFLLNVKTKELDEFCQALRATVSGMSARDVSALPHILMARAPYWATQRDYDNSLLSCHQEDLGGEAVLAAYSTVTMLRIRDEHDRSVAFGITWGDGGNSKPGDEICLLEGCSHALILRAESPPWWNLWRRHWRGQHRIIGSTVIRGGGSREQDWFNEVRAHGDLDDIFLR